MLCGVDSTLKSTEVNDFLDVDRFNWTRTLSTISAMSSFAAFAGDYTPFGDEPKIIAYSDGTQEACYRSNLAWFLVTGLMLPVVISMMFSSVMQNLDPTVFVDADANPDADTDADLDLDADADFELIFLKVISTFLNVDFLEDKR
uniref:Uncharacterized protein n=1 Tax=Solanum tuberosum TaxID=4113 RepID=M1BBI3_SOLTU